MGRIIVVANQKGGVGKTTTTVNLAASLAAAEKKTLLLDVDPQSNSSSALGVRVDNGKEGIYQALIHKTELAKLIRETDLKLLNLIPSHRELAGAEVELAGMTDREYRLRDLLASVRGEYQYIILDTPPALGFLTINALVAADSVLIPVQCEYLALEGLSELLSTIKRIRAALNPELGIEGILLTMFDDRLNLANQVREEVRSFFKDTLFNVVIPRNVKLGEAPSFGKPVLLYDIKSSGAQAYLKLAGEILNNEKERSW